jgi:hypothetical protein
MKVQKCTRKTASGAIAGLDRIPEKGAQKILSPGKWCSNNFDKINENR